MYMYVSIEHPWRIVLDKEEETKEKIISYLVTNMYSLRTLDFYKN